jgi:predicted transcriptional regulator
MKYRCKIDLAADVLFASLECEKKTHIMNHCNMNFKQLYVYLNMLTISGLLSFNPVSDSYSVTEHGKMFLKLFKIYKQHLLQFEKKLGIVREERSQLEQMCPS